LLDSPESPVLSSNNAELTFVHRGVKLSFGQFATLVILG
jgi:hypothetical protein